MNNMGFIDGMNKAWDLAFRLIGEDKDGWIPVEERLPEDMTPVLVTNWHNHVLTAVYSEEKKFFVETSLSYVIPIVSAWIPLPEPYQKGE